MRGGRLQDGTDSSGDQGSAVSQGDAGNSGCHGGGMPWWWDVMAVQENLEPRDMLHCLTNMVRLDHSGRGR